MTHRPYHRRQPLLKTMRTYSVNKSGVMHLSSSTMAAMSSRSFLSLCQQFAHVIRFGDNVYVNSNSVWIDTCLISVGARTLIGPNCSFYSGTHPTDPTIRNGTKGPESGKPITIGEDCWFGGNVIVLPGVTIGQGSTMGAGSVVTKDVPPYSVVVGNPARVVRTITPSTVPHSSPGTATLK